MLKENKYYPTQENLCDQIYNYIKTNTDHDVIKINIKKDFKMNIFFNTLDEIDMDNMIDMLISIARRFHVK